MNLSGVGKNVLWFVIGLAAAAAVMSIWLFPDRTDTSITLRSYEVSPDIAAEMRSALSSALGPRVEGLPPLGRVTLGPNGRLLVSATESVQSGVQRVISEVSGRNLEPTPSLLFEAWLVTASAGGPEPAGSSTSPPSRLTEIEPALAAIRKARGPLRFELVEKLATQARSGTDDSEVHGARALMRVVPTIRLGENDKPVVSAVFHIQIYPRPGETPGQQPAIKSMAGAETWGAAG